MGDSFADLSKAGDENSNLHGEIVMFVTGCYGYLAHPVPNSFRKK